MCAFTDGTGGFKPPHLWTKFGKTHDPQETKKDATVKHQNKRETKLCDGCWHLAAAPLLPNVAGHGSYPVSSDTDGVGTTCLPQAAPPSARLQSSCAGKPEVRLQFRTKAESKARKMHSFGLLNEKKKHVLDVKTRES